MVLVAEKVVKKLYNHSVKSILNYLTFGGNAVFMSALDATKAFDKVNHYSLLILLINNNISLPYLCIIIYIGIYI